MTRAFPAPAAALLAAALLGGCIGSTPGDGLKVEAGAPSTTNGGATRCNFGILPAVTLDGVNVSHFCAAICAGQPADHCDERGYVPALDFYLYDSHGDQAGPFDVRSTGTCDCPPTSYTGKASWPTDGTHAPGRVDLGVDLTPPPPPPGE